MIATRSSFYQAEGGSLAHDAPSYVERAADRELFDALCQGEFCYVLTSRQMGKSSLMVRTTHRLRDQGTHVVVLDLSAMGENLSAEQWYLGLLGVIGTRLDLEDELDDFWFAHEQLGPLRRWMEALRQVVLPNLGVQVFRSSGVQADGPSPPEHLNTRTPEHPRRLVIFIDEIDVVQSLPFSTDEFFAAIRECYNRRTEDPVFERLTFCLLGVASPASLIRDVRTTPFNIGRRIELHDFTEVEAAPLRIGLALGSLETLGTSDAEARALLQRVLYWTGGHPYLTQRLCRAVVDRQASGVGQAVSLPDGDERQADSLPHSPAAMVDALCEELFLSTRAREQDDNLLFVRNWLLKSEEERASLLELYGQVRRGKRVAVDSTSPLVETLRLAGIARVEEAPSLALSLSRSLARPRLRVRNRIYERVFDGGWVAQHMPDAEVRRQKAAYRRGLLRATAVGGAIAVVMGGLALTAWTQTHRARQLSRSLQVSLRTEQQARREAETQKNDALQARQGERQQKEAAVVARGQAERQQNVAETKALEAKQQKDRAEQERGRANGQRQLAVQQTEASRARLVRLNVATGMRLVDDGDLLLALPWLAEALTLDRGRPEREAIHRLRLAAVLQQSPKPSQIMVHEGLVFSVAFSPDGRRIVTGCGDGAARVWDATTGALALPPLRHRGPVFRVAFSPDGRRIVTASTDKTARVWDAANGRPLGLPLKHDGDVSYATFSPDSLRVATASSDQTARVWDATTGRPVTSSLRHKGKVLQVVFSPDGRRVVTASGDSTARVWSAVTGEQVMPPLNHLAAVYTATFSPDGRRIATSSSDQTVSIWDAVSGKPAIAPLRLGSTAYWVTFSPDGRRIATTSGQTAQIWDAATGRAVTPTLRHNGPVTYACFSSDGRRLMTASADGTARVWDAASGKPVTPSLKHSGPVESVAFSADNRRVVTSSWDQTVRVWDLATASLPTRSFLHSNWVAGGAAFSPDGSRIVTASADQTARVWDVVTGRSLTPVLKHGGSVRHAGFSPDGRRVITASNDQTARIWDAATGAPLTRPLQHHGPVSFAAFSPDGRRVITTSDDQTAQIWDAVTGRPVTPALKHVRPVVFATFSPDGRAVLTTTHSPVQYVPGEARVWNAATGAPITPSLVHGDGVLRGGFSPDGRRVLTASRDNTARVWDARTGRPLLPPLKHKGLVLYAEFSPDGRRIATASGDETARVWDAFTGRPVTPPLPHAGWVEYATFSPDGRMLATASSSEAARVWDAGTGEPITPSLKPGGDVWQVQFSPNGRRLLIVGEVARIWDLPREDRPMADLKRLTQTLSGYGIDPTAGAVPLELKTVGRDWRSLRGHSTADFVAAPSQSVVWHDLEAESAERAREWSAALPHLDALLAAPTAGWQLFARRGLAHAELGHWDRASSDFARALELGADFAGFRVQLALTQLGGGDVEGYRRTYAGLLDQLGDSDDAAAVGLIYALAPAPLPNEARALQIAEKAVAAGPKNYPALSALGGALYRAGRFEDATRRLNEAEAAPGPRRNSRHAYWLAMCHAKMGNGAEARRWLEAANRWLDQALQRTTDDETTSALDWRPRFILQHLRHEAETLIGSAR